MTGRFEGDLPVPKVAQVKFRPQVYEATFLLSLPGLMSLDGGHWIGGIGLRGSSPYKPFKWDPVNEVKRQVGIFFYLNQRKIS